MADVPWIQREVFKKWFLSWDTKNLVLIVCYDKPISSVSLFSLSLVSSPWDVGRHSDSSSMPCDRWNGEKDKEEEKEEERRIESGNEEKVFLSLFFFLAEIDDESWTTFCYFRPLCTFSSWRSPSPGRVFETPGAKLLVEFIPLNPLAVADWGSSISYTTVSVPNFIRNLGQMYWIEVEVDHTTGSLTP